MAIHACRDFLATTNPLNTYGPYVGNYLVTIFLRAVLNFTIVGQTNWNIDSATYRLATGINGSLNQGGQDVYAFAPTGYTPTVNDIGRILAVRSPGNPLQNSGLFRITSINTAQNWFYIDYRSGDVPPPETGMTWVLYEKETVFNGAVTNGGNGIVNTYQTQGTANASRIILQSPSPAAWQVRFCVESAYDQPGGGGGVTPTGGFGGGGVTCAPGYGGNSAGDFPVGGQHLHAILYFNTHDVNHLGATQGFWPAGAGGGDNVVRYYMWGDDQTGSCFAAARDVVGPSDSHIHFGLPEDEEQPLPPHPAQRLFVMGANGLVNGGANGIYWACGPGNNRFGAAFGLSNQPISCIYSLYNPLAQFVFQPGNQAARNLSNAQDSPYTNATELISVDLLAGTHDYMYNYYDSNEHFILEGRRLGRAPLVRMGRSNTGYFQITTDRAWLHLADGIYAPWQGSILP